jgi:hypothetical protein
MGIDPGEGRRMTVVSATHRGEDARAKPGQDTVEFAVLPDPNWVVEPFRSRVADLVELFETPDAGKPQWHRGRAAALRNEARVHPVAAVSDAYLRLAARHVATARLLEHDEACWPKSA